MMSIETFYNIERKTVRTLKSLYPKLFFEFRTLEKQVNILKKCVFAKFGMKLCDIAKSPN